MTFARERWSKSTGGASRMSPPSLAEALQDYSIELNPKGAKLSGESLARLEPGTEVFLTWIPGADPMEMVAFAANLRRVGVVACSAYWCAPRPEQSATRAFGRTTGK